MDPHDLQNNLNLGAGAGNVSQPGTSAMPSSQGQPQYNQMLLQQQYMNNFQFYGNNQMLSMDPFQQQQYLMMQTQQMQPMFQQPQQQVLQQHLISQQQQQQQRFAQAQQQQQHQALQSQQQRLLEEQQRQMEVQRQEELARQRQKEAEEQLRQQELMRQREKERQEQQRQMEEAARVAEEQRRREERERVEREKLVRIREEQLKKQKDSQQMQREMMERMGQVAEPLALVATHFINKYTTLLPFPSENLSTSKLPSVSSNDEETLQLLNCTDPAMVAMISTALSKVDVNDIRTRLDHHEGLAETNDLPLDQMPPLIKRIMEHNCNALDVEPEHNMGIADTEHLLNEMQDDLDGQGPARVLNPSVTQPSTSDSSSAAPTTSALPAEKTPQVQIQLDSQDAIKLRRQMASVGKQPKAGGTQRKKRDMVECLYDSLTDYFDPSAGRRRRTRNQDDDADLQHDLELIARMEAGETLSPQTAEVRADDAVSGGASGDEESRFFEKKKKRKKEEKTEDRPPTPTEVIHLREQEWKERQRKKQEKRRRQRADEEDSQCWNNDVMAENDSFTRFSGLVDQVLDQVEDMDVEKACNGGRIEDNEDELEEDEEISQELLLERQILDDLRKETLKLKSWKKLNKVPMDRLVKLLTILERNMRDVISYDGTRLLVPVLLEEDGEEDDAALRELVHERLLRAVDAACTALNIMTSHKMPKQVFMEDVIERAILLSKQYLNNIIFPASDSMFRMAAGGKKAKAEDSRRKRKAGTSNRSHTVQLIYDRMAELIGCFSEMIRVQQLPENNIHQLASMSIASFFVSNVGELQVQAMCLSSNIFSMADDHVRVSCLNDILNSLHRLPPGKNTNNSYRLGAEQWISNTTVLVMQLIQSVVKVPKRRRHDEESSGGKKSELSPDAVVRDSFREAQRLTGLFLSGFLSKCSCKGNKSEGEEDYRRLFDGFLQDLLVALYKPEWPAAEMMLTILGTLLVKHYRTKTTDIVIRQACLDYLGSITARLRRDIKSVGGLDSEHRMELVVKTLLFEEQEQEDQQWDRVENVDISQLSTTDRLKKLEQALIDFLVEKKGENVGIEYAIKFYAGEWYKETAEDLDMAKQQFKENRTRDMTEKDRRKLEKKMDRMNEKGASMKEFLIRLADKKSMRKRAEMIARLGNVMLESDAAWAVKYLASRREFSHSFDIYLRHILFGVTAETTVSLRTKSMRCLTQIIEADHEVLGMADVRQAVNSRMMDPNAAVREATIELLGKFLLAKEEFIPTYYGILLERIKDSGTAVRKRVIRIMREICEKYPSYEKIPDMLSKLVRRVVDEDGVKKLVHETFGALWLHPCTDRGDQLSKKVVQMTEVAQLCATDSTSDYLEQLLLALLKQADKSAVFASRQIVDCLVDTVLALENKMAKDAGAAPATSNGEDLSSAQLQKNNQERLLASLTTLSMFSKVRPELLVRHAETLQPYLSMAATTPAEQQVLNEVICMLERVVPLMSHPSDSFLQSLDVSLSHLLVSSGMAIVVSVVGCAAAVWNNFPRKETAMTQRFLFFLRNLNQLRLQYQSNPQFQPPANRLPLLQRSVFSLGLLARYFDFDSILENDPEAAKSLVQVTLPPNLSGIGADAPEAQQGTEGEEKPVLRRFRDNVFVVLEFFSHSNNQSIRLKALTSIGHLCASYAEYLGRIEVKNMYMAVLGANEPHYLQLKIQALKNLELFLLAEEKKMIKSNADWEKAKEHQNLKEMELAGSGLGSAVIQIYWNNVLNCYFHPNEMVRQTAVQVTWLTLSQGLVTPGSSIPTLIAMITDPVPAIRNRVDNLLREIDAKYAGMVQSKSIAGIRIAFRLHSMIRGGKNGANQGVVRGIRACDTTLTAMNAKVAKDPFGVPRYSNDGQAILSGLYASLRANRSHRRSFMNSVLRLFSEDCREKLSLSEWIFVADNIAMFPYQVLDEPLYAIRHIDGIISLSGQSIVNQFKDHLLPASSLNQGGPQEDDDALFEPENLFRRFPEDKHALYELMLNSQACFILLYLKNFLIKLYGFTEAKVQEYSPSEAAKVYEKAVTRRNCHMFHPQSALEELRPEVIEERNSLQGHYKLAHKICNFRKMLLSLDRLDEDGDLDDEGITTGVTERDDDEDIDGETDVGEPESEGPSTAMEE